jgi:hypothetical protein
MLYRHNHDFIFFENVDEAERKSVQQQSPQISIYVLARFWVNAQSVDSPLHIFKKINCKSTGNRFMEQRGFRHFFFRWREEAVWDHLRRLRTRVMTSSPG